MEPKQRHISNSMCCVLLLLLALTCLPGHATAQQFQDGGWFADTTLAGAYQPSANFKGASGSVSSGRTFLEATVGYAFDMRNRLALSLGGGVSFYDFDGRPPIGQDEPWERIQDLRVDLPLSFGITDDLTAFLAPGIRWNLESGARFDDGRTEGVRAGFSYRFNDSFLIGPGFGWFTSLDGGSSFYPILLIDWDVTERINVSTGGGLAASQGPGITVSYRINGQLKIGVSGRKESRSFRLDESGAVPGGIGRDGGVPLVTTFEYRPVPSLRVNAFAGVKFAGEISLENAAGEELAESDYELVPIFGLSMRTRF